MLTITGSDGDLGDVVVGDADQAKRGEESVAVDTMKVTNLLMP